MQTILTSGAGARPHPLRLRALRIHVGKKLVSDHARTHKNPCAAGCVCSRVQQAKAAKRGAAEAEGVQEARLLPSMTCRLRPSGGLT